jgi:L-alanine dehydrogenase (EC 1.4.1.1)
MIIGVPKEIKTHEYRVGLVPGSVRELTRAGHKILVETNAGAAIGFSDEIYQEAGAEIVPTAKEVFDRAEMIVKVKEPQPEECRMLREGQLLFTYLHLAADKEQAEGLIQSKAIAIAYETVTNNRNQLPLLTPMSEVAGRMSIQVGARCLEKYSGGSGTLLGGVPGVEPGHVVIIGGGVVGTAAARMAMGLEANVTIIDRSNERLQELDAMYGSRLNKIYSTYENIERYVAMADLVIGAVLVPGAAAPKLVNRAMLKNMRPGSALVDVAIDQGGCFETSRPTTHANPTYDVDGIIHYCVTNMPGAVARTSAAALNNATLPFVLALAKKGYKEALRDDRHLLNGLNAYHGHITYKAVAEDLGYDYVSPESALV